MALDRRNFRQVGEEEEEGERWSREGEEEEGGEWEGVCAVCTVSIMRVSLFGGGGGQEGR